MNEEILVNIYTTDSIINFVILRIPFLELKNLALIKRE